MDAVDGASEERPGADYGPAAAPERQPALATFLPCRVGGLAIAAVGILVIAAVVTGPSLVDATFGRSIFGLSKRFTRTLAAVQHCLDITAPGSLASWTGQMMLIAAAMVAWCVRGMRRHRRDDYSGRFRAWGWMACLLLVTSLAEQVPLGEVVASLFADGTGWAFGPRGLGWWISLATVALATVALWAVLPLRERTGTASWLGTSAMLGVVSMGCLWATATSQGNTQIAVTGRAAWVFATATTLIAMLSAARGVIREIRGEVAMAQPRGTRKPKARAAITTEPADIESEPEAEPDDEDRVVLDESSDRAIEFTDGSDESSSGGRKLTKAERKRLKRMARLQQAG